MTLPKRFQLSPLNRMLQLRERRKVGGAGIDLDARQEAQGLKVPHAEVVARRPAFNTRRGDAATKALCEMLAGGVF